MGGGEMEERLNFLQDMIEGEESPPMDMAPAERIAYLRARGVEVDLPEERAAAADGVARSVRAAVVRAAAADGAACRAATRPCRRSVRPLRASMSEC